MGRRTAIATVTGIVLLATACGENRPSSAAFTERVRSICSASQQRHDEAAKGFDFNSFDPDTSELSTIVPLIEKHVAIGREAARELEKVRGPEADEAKAREYVAIVRQMHELGEKEADAARRGDRAAFKQLTAQEDALVSKLPHDDRFEGC